MKTDVEQAVAKNDDGGRDLYVLLLDGLWQKRGQTSLNRYWEGS